MGQLIILIISLFVICYIIDYITIIKMRNLIKTILNINDSILYREHYEQFKKLNNRLIFKFIHKKDFNYVRKVILSNYTWKIHKNNNI